MHTDITKIFLFPYYCLLLKMLARYVKVHLTNIKEEIIRKRGLYLIYSSENEGLNENLHREDGLLVLTLMCFTPNYFFIFTVLKPVSPCASLLGKMRPQKHSIHRRYKERGTREMRMTNGGLGSTN